MTYEDGSVGDARDDFALLTFYPPQLHPLVAPVSSVCFSCWECVGCCAYFKSANALPTSTVAANNTQPVSFSPLALSTAAAPRAVEYTAKYAIPFSAGADPIAERRR